MAEKKVKKHRDYLKVRDNKITVRVTVAEKKALEYVAALNGANNLTEWLRYCVWVQSFRNTEMASEELLEGTPNE